MRCDQDDRSSTLSSAGAVASLLIPPPIITGYQLRLSGCGLVDRENKALSARLSRAASRLDCSGYRARTKHLTSDISCDSHRHSIPLPLALFFHQVPVALPCGSWTLPDRLAPSRRARASLCLSLPPFTCRADRSRPPP
jgi:hypothetical protein